MQLLDDLVTPKAIKGCQYFSFVIFACKNKPKYQENISFKTHIKFIQHSMRKVQKLYLICTKLQINNIHFQLHYFAPVDFMNGVQTSLASNFEPNSNYLKTETIQDHQDILNLLRQMPKYLEEIQVLLDYNLVLCFLYS